MSDTEWVFFGKIAPERIPISFRFPGSILSFQGNEFSISEIVVADNQLVCRTKYLKGTLDILLTKNLLDDYLRGFLDLLGYLHGIPFDLELLSAASGNGETIIFELGIPALKQVHNLSLGRQEISSALIFAAIHNTGAKAALSDIRKAMRDATGTGFYCYRAIESLMQASTKDWEQFRDALNIRRDMIDYVKALSDDRRHGRIPDITDEQRKKYF